MEYIQDVSGRGVRAVLSTLGGARVDVPSAQEGRRGYTVLVPTSGDEVRRLALVIQALVELPPLEARPEYPSMDEKQVLLRCSLSGRERCVMIGPYEQHRNLVWGGVVEEIETVSLLNFAKAVAAHEEAEWLIQRGDLVGARREYEVAVHLFRQWGGERCGRYRPDFIWEPEVGMGSRYRDATKEGKPVEGVTTEKSLEFLRFSWDVYTRERAAGTVLSLSRSDNVIVVKFAETSAEENWIWGLPVGSIPPRARRALSEPLQAKNGASAP